MFISFKRLEPSKLENRIKKVNILLIYYETIMTTINRERKQNRSKKILKNQDLTREGYRNIFSKNRLKF